MTSTDSMLSALICRRSTPVPALVPRDVLSETGTPSTMMDVPKALLAVLSLALRMVIFASEVMSEDCISWPGMSCITSFRLVAWRWSMAIRPMFELVEEPAALGFAVTTTSSRARVDSWIRTVNVESLRKRNISVKSSKPSIWMDRVASPAGTFSRRARPSASVMAKIP